MKKQYLDVEFKICYYCKNVIATSGEGRIDEFYFDGFDIDITF